MRLGLAGPDVLGTDIAFLAEPVGAARVGDRAADDLDNVSPGVLPLAVAELDLDFLADQLHRRRSGISAAVRVRI